MCERTLELDDTQAEMLARMCHEANRGICAAQGDFDQSPWDEAPDWQRASCLEGVRKAFNSFRTDPRENHDGWMEIKLRDGWRYGPTKNAEEKTHPCLLPFDALPAEQKIKDQVFLSIVQGWRMFKQQDAAKSLFKAQQAQRNQ